LFHTNDLESQLLHEIYNVFPLGIDGEMPISAFTDISDSVEGKTVSIFLEKVV
jgi:hypothetical protein